MARLTEKIIMAGSVTPISAIPTAHRFMSAVTEGALCSVSGEAVRGVIIETAVANEMVSVAEIGHVLVETGAAIVAGASVQTDATGRAIPLAAGAKAGLALSSAGAAGQLIQIRVPS